MTKRNIQNDINIDKDDNQIDVMLFDQQNKLKKISEISRHWLLQKEMALTSCDISTFLNILWHCCSNEGKEVTQGLHVLET